LGAKRFFIFWLVSAVVGAVPGCASVIGLGDFNVGGASASGAAAGSDHAGASTAGDAGNGGDSGSAEAGSTNGGSPSGGAAGSTTGGTAGAGGAACPGDCDDNNGCTDDSCVAGVCENHAVMAGTTCGTGRTCDDNAVCVRCRDTAAGKAQDEGCSAGAPVCMGTGTAATCAGCTKDVDCDDGNDCTTEKCSVGSCVFMPVAAGQMCSAGVCNGSANAEKCVACLDDAVGPSKDSGCSLAAPACDTSGTAACYACAKDSDCASDAISCTNDTCVNHACKHVADDSKCTASGNVCKPNRCDAALGCKSVDITMTTPLITASSTSGNGSFENGINKMTAVGWPDSGDDYVIYNCTNPGCTGSAGTTLMAAGDGNLLAWFAGTDYASVDQIDHLIHVPAGTTTLLIQADTNVQTISTTLANKDSFDVLLLDSQQVQLGSPVVTLTNVTAQTATTVWSANGINKTVDVSAQSDKDIYLRLRSTVDATLPTDFFIDNVRVTATVCN
jgi:hypothetical protein